MWRKNYICRVCKKWAWDKVEHFPDCKLASSKPEAVKAPKEKPQPKVEAKPEVKEVKKAVKWESFYAGGGKNAVYDVRLGGKKGELAEGGDNIPKDKALALVEQLNK